MKSLDPVAMLLAFCTAFFTLCLFATMAFWKDDGQMFQVISGMATGSFGAFVGYIVPRSRE